MKITICVLFFLSLNLSSQNKGLIEKVDDLENRVRKLEKTLESKKKERPSIEETVKWLKGFCLSPKSIVYYEWHNSQDKYLKRSSKINGIDFKNQNLSFKNIIEVTTSTGEIITQVEFKLNIKNFTAEKSLTKAIHKNDLSDTKGYHKLKDGNYYAYSIDLNSLKGDKSITKTIMNPSPVIVNISSFTLTFIDEESRGRALKALKNIQTLSGNKDLF